MIDSCFTRWIIRRDLPEVLEIERSEFGACAWTEDDFLKALRARATVGKVVEYRGRVIGYMVYTVYRDYLDILNLAVAPQYQLKGVGRLLVCDRKESLVPDQPDRRSALKALVRETNLGAQLFFRANGFKVEETVRDCYIETDEDGYRFVYRVPSRVLSNG